MEYSKTQRRVSMDIPEAIEELEDMLLVMRTLFPPKTKAAVGLGIEALKHCKEYRETSECAFSWLLPGETEE
jgi:hypothetical protein